MTGSLDFSNFLKEISSLSHSVVVLYFCALIADDRSKARCCKEQHCIGTWNVKAINQGKLEVVKQEMARVNVSILGISKLK